MSNSLSLNQLIDNYKIKKLSKTPIEQEFFEIARLGTSVFGNFESFNSWLTLPCLPFNGKTPCQQFDETQSLSDLKVILIRLEYGVYT